MEHQITESENEQGIKVVCHYLTGNSNSYEEISELRAEKDYKESDNDNISHKEATIFEMKSRLLLKIPSDSVRYYFKIHKYVKFTTIKSTFDSKTQIIHK